MKKLIAILLAALLIASMLTACGEKIEEPGQPDETETSTPPVTTSATPDNTPPPPPALPADELAGLWSAVDGSTSTIPLTEAIHKHFGVEGAPPEHNMTSHAYYNLINGHSHIIFVTRPSENELAMAEEAGVELEVIPVTKDALVFLVNVDNPVKSVALSELRDIYTGDITNWSQVGGSAAGIIPYQRPVGSGSQTLFLQLLMGDKEPMDPPSEWRPSSMGGLVELVSNYDNSVDAIGFSVFYYVNSMYGNSRFRLLGVDGVVPTRETIARGEYALEDYYYAVIRKTAKPDGIERRLIEWLLTDEGQTVAAAAGYVPLRPIGDVGQDSIDPVYLGDTDNSSGTGGTVPLVADERSDMLNESVKKPLSDMFFDGFNYVRYINEEIIAQLQFFADDLWPQIPLQELDGMRPFTGIPNDYPNYRLSVFNNYYGQVCILYIEFPEGNPFFSYAQSFNITLTSDISPYGGEPERYSVTYDYARQLMEHVELYTLSVDLPDAPNVSARINAQLKTWSDGFENDREAVRKLDSFVDWYAGIVDMPDFIYRLQPMSGQWGDYLAVSYILHTYDGPPLSIMMVYTICFDMKTGEVVRPSDMRGIGELDYSKAQLFSEASFENEGSPWLASVQEEYSLKAGSEITDAWVIYGTLNLRILEPNGRALQLSFWN